MEEVHESLFSKFLKETPEQLDTLQKELLKKIQKRSGRKTLAYLANFKTHPHNMINFDDKSKLVLLVDSLKDIKEIDFILHSPGGFAESVEMMVKLLRSKFNNIRFIIPHSAKSAATMLALSGNEILMSPSAELGPIDPQVSGDVNGPAQSIIDGFEDIKKAVEKDKKLNGAYIPILNKMDVSTVKQCEIALKYGKTIVKDWIVNYMFADERKLNLRKKKFKANSISKFFSDHRKHMTHGRPISWDEASKKGVKVRNIEEVDKDLAELIKEYYLRFENIFSTGVINKIFHSENEYMVNFTPVLKGVQRITLPPLPISPQKPVRPEAPPQSPPNSPQGTLQ